MAVVDVSPANTASSRLTWWQDEVNAASLVTGVAETVSQYQASRAANFVRFAALYGNWDMFNAAVTVYGRLSTDNRFSRLTYNIIQSMVDTVVAKHAATQPRVEVLTENGDWEQQKKAKLATKFVAAEVDRLKLYRKAPLVLRDACVFGDGYLKFYHAHGKICIERVFPGEIIVDEGEAINGEPRQLFQVRYVSKEVLVSLYPEYESEIERACKADLVHTVGPNVSNMVRVVEAWHLP